VAAVIAVVSQNGANQYVATRVFRLALTYWLSKQPSIVTNVDDWLEFQSANASLTTTLGVRGLCKSVRKWRFAGRRIEVKAG